MIGEILVGRFRLEERLGGGAQGEIYKARDLELSRWVAIKIPKEDDNDDFIATFKREAKLLVKFEHDNVVTLHDYYEPDEGMPFLVMEYLKGDPLDVRLLDLDNPLTHWQLSRFVEQICSALHKAHNAGLIHRDIKPSNVMLVDEGKPDEKFVILDLGIAKLADFVTVTGGTMMAPEGEFFGTIAYMSPEQLEGRKVDSRCDIYAFGTTLYQILTGKLPFEPPETYAGIFGFMQKVVRDDPPSMTASMVGELAPKNITEIPQALEELVQRCMAKDAAERPATMSDVWEDFRVAFPGETSGTLSDTQTLSQETLKSLEIEIIKKSRWRHLAWASAATLLVVALVVWLLRPGPSLSIVKPPEQFAVIAGDTSVLDLTIDSNHATKVRVSIPAISGVSFNGSGYGNPLEATVAITDDGPQEYSIEADARPTANRGSDAEAKVEVHDENGELLAAVTVDIEPPKVWLPDDAGFTVGANPVLYPHPSNESSGKAHNIYLPKIYLPERIVREIVAADGTKNSVPFMLIHRGRLEGGRQQEANWPGGLQPFYLMENKVSNELVSAFLEAVPEEIDGAAWVKDDREWLQHPESHPERPAMNLTVGEAYAVAKWIGGRLGEIPTQDEWDIASGYYDRDLKSVSETWPEGPFRGRWDQDPRPQVCIDRLEDRFPPENVGTSADDIGPYGCRDMAGNGYEFTGDVYFDFSTVAGRLPLWGVPKDQLSDYMINFRGQSYDNPKRPFMYQLLDPPKTHSEYTEYPDRCDDTGFRVMLPIVRR